MTSGGTGKQYSNEELKQALWEVEDLMDQLLTPFFLLGKTAECVKNNLLLEGDGIDIGIRDKSLTQYFFEIIADKFKLAKDQVENGFELKSVSGIPIRVKVYTRNYYFFKYPNVCVYEFGSYWIPNPWDGYWKSRGLIK